MRRLAALALAFGLVAGAAGYAALRLFPPALPERLSAALSDEVNDRDGRLLRAFQTSSGHWRFPLTRTEVDPLFPAMLLAYEDKRFFRHSGVDALALLRAAGQGLSSGRIVSGASTLSMQVARILAPEREGRGLARKARDMRLAFALETQLGKDRILDLYLTHAPYGGNVEGLRAASLSYFGHEPRRLTPGEAALLVALPQSPETRRPDRFPEAARRARDRVIQRMQAAGVLTAEQAEAAVSEPVPQARRAMPSYAFHLAEAQRGTQGRVTRLTLDRALQASLEALVKERAQAAGPKLSAALIVADIASGNVLAQIGAADPFDLTRGGGLDMVQALRSPGSALKPLIYTMAFESGIAHPETLIDDRPQNFNGYAPNNFDLGFQGTVNLRQALQMSLNIPAVALLDVIGPRRLIARLEQTGARPVLPKGEVPGLAVGLGGLGLSLHDLATAYGVLARGGEAFALSVSGEGANRRERLFDEAAAWQVADILREAPAPQSAATGQIAFKTGTSYGYRDAFAIGFDGKHLVAAWIGRPDASSVPGLSGRSHAAPILFDAFARLGPLTPLAARPASVLVASNARLPAPLQRFGQAARPHGAVETLAIAYPPDGSRVALIEPDGSLAPLALKTSGGRGPFTVLLNGAPVTSESGRQPAEIHPDGPGFHRLSVIDGEGRSASVTVRVE